MELITNLTDRFRVDNLFKKEVKKPTFKVHFAVCNFKNVELQVGELFMDLKACPDPKISPKSYEGDGLISRIRNTVASRFLETDKDILWFWDQDVISSTMDVTKMMWEMWKYDLDILCAPYPLRSETEKCFAIRTLEDKGSFLCGEGGKIHEIRYGSTGCLGIRRRVLESMVKGLESPNRFICEQKEIVHDDGKISHVYVPIEREKIVYLPLCHPETRRTYSFFNPMDYNLNGKWIALSEDWAFCQRAKDLGFKVFCDFGIKLGHKDGNHIYTFDDFFREPVKKLNSFNYNVDIKIE